MQFGPEYDYYAKSDPGGHECQGTTKKFVLVKAYNRVPLRSELRRTSRRVFRGPDQVGPVDVRWAILAFASKKERAWRIAARRAQAGAMCVDIKLQGPVDSCTRRNTEPESSSARLQSKQAWAPLRIKIGVLVISWRMAACKL